MSISKDILEYGMSIFCGKTFKICVIDFVRFRSNLSKSMIKRHGDLRDELVKKFCINSEDCSNENTRRCKWTLEIICSQSIKDAIDFNRQLKSMPESHEIIFVCLDDEEISPLQQTSLQCSYINSTFFQFDGKCVNIYCKKILNYLQGTKMKKIRRKILLNFYPLLLHINSISTGLVFNYYFSYLNRHVTSTNNIFITFTFNTQINCQLFPKIISIQLNTFIENIFLEDYSSTVGYDNLSSIQSNILQLIFDPQKYKFIHENNQTIVTYSLCGTQDFGAIGQKVSIWQDTFHHNDIISIELKDDIRRWDQQYQLSPPFNSENNNENIMFEDRNDSTKKCYLYSTCNIPNITDGHPGISTMKKTTKDCYDMYIKDPKNKFTEDGREISKTLLIPTYYIIIPSSCQFEPININETIVKGTIFDPDQPSKIRLAKVNGETLRSPPLLHFNRYLRRTFYYFDEIDNNNEIIRYLFSGEYPFILSTLNNIENIDKRDEYLRFCSILHRLIHIDDLSSSIKLIQINDESLSNQINGESLSTQIKDESLSIQIKKDIDQYYQTLDDQIIFSPIHKRILYINHTNRILLFFTNNAREDQSIIILINDLKEKLEENDFIVEDAQGDLNCFNTEEQIIFICTGKKEKRKNRLIINAIQHKINKFGVLRDVFILINDAIKHFPCRFIRSIPYLTFDLQRRSSYLTPADIQQLIHYLNNMNILSKSYKDNFEDINEDLRKSPLQCTDVGGGCAAAFYFNYMKLLMSLPEHKLRIELINKELENENLIDQKSKFIDKWIFVLPSMIKNINDIISYGLNINQNEQEKVRFKLSIWKPSNPNLIIPTVTKTLGGIVDRSYSPLTIYKLTNLDTQETFYFPMEIPAALNGLENQYKNVLSHFNFGYFDPLKQGLAFQNKVQEYFSNDQDQICHSKVIFILIDNSEIIDLTKTGNFLRTLWQNISLSD